MYSEDKNILYWPTSAAKTEQKSLVPARRRTTQGPLSFLLVETPFTSVSTVSRSHPSLVYLVPATVSPSIGEEGRPLSVHGREKGKKEKRIK